VLDDGMCAWIFQNRIIGILVAEQESQTSAVARKKSRSFSLIPVAKFSMYQCRTEFKKKKVGLYHSTNNFLC